MEPLERPATQPAAKITGFVYLCYFVAAFSGIFLMQGIVIPTDPVATANNMVLHESAYRAGFAISLVANAIYLAVTALFYRLFGPVNWNVSLVAAFLSVAGCSVQIFGGLLQLAPFVFLQGNQAVQTFTVAQLRSAALLSYALYAQIFNISLVLFAIYDVLLGYLILRSKFLPRVLGAFLIIAGVGWLSFLWPPLAKALSSVVMPVGALAEISLMAWLLVKGVDVPAWQEKAANAGMTRLGAEPASLR